MNLRKLHRAALITIGVLVTAASVASFAESYRAVPVGGQHKQYAASTRPRCAASAPRWAWAPPSPSLTARRCATGSASGGFNVADCEIGQNPVTGQWENDNG